MFWITLLNIVGVKASDRGNTDETLKNTLFGHIIT